MDRRRYRNFVFDSARWDGFLLRPGDIVISTPAKCGTTWTQMLVALLIFRTAELPAPLSTLSPWLDMQIRPRDEVVAALDAQSHRRFVKTHTPLDGIPFDPDVTYVFVGRDPRDVALSWDRHQANMDLDRLVATRLAAVGADDLGELGLDGPPPPPPEDPLDRFAQWLTGEGPTGDTSSLPMLVHHTATFWDRDDPNLVRLHYGDLHADLAGEMARLAEALGLAPPTPELVDAARFAAMRDRAGELAPQGTWRDVDGFFDQARLGAWRDVLDERARQRYAEAAAATGRPDLIAWLEQGRAAALR